MKRALLLSGGGSFGAFEVGAIDYLIRQERLDFDFFIGTSVGALNAGFLGQATNFEELCQCNEKLKNFWSGIDGYQMIFNRSIIGDFVLLFRDYLYKPTGLTRIIEQNIDFKKLCGNPAKNVKIAVVAMETGEIVFADNQRPEYWADFPKYILASASMPLYFPGVQLNSKRWFDGGLRDITPLGKIFDDHPDEIVIVTTYPVERDLSPCFRKEKKSGGTINVLLRTIDILANEVGANDIKIAHYIGEQTESIPGRDAIPLKLISPKCPLPGNDALDFDPQRIKDIMDMGREAAKEPKPLCFKKISKCS